MYANTPTNSDDDLFASLELDEDLIYRPSIGRSVTLDSIPRDTLPRAQTRDHIPLRTFNRTVAPNPQTTAIHAKLKNIIAARVVPAGYNVISNNMRNIVEPRDIIINHATDTENFIESVKVLPTGVLVIGALVLFYAASWIMGLLSYSFGFVTQCDSLVLNCPAIGVLNFVILAAAWAVLTPIYTLMFIGIAHFRGK